MITVIARNYARAFINVFDNKLSRETIEQLKKTIQFLKKQRRAAFLLAVPTIKPEVKQKGLAELCARFDLPTCFSRLFETLLDHRRGYLLLQVFEGIVAQYNQSHDIVTITISSSCNLSAIHQKDIKAFADRNFHGIKEYEFKVDPSLIAGVKLSSGTLLWESSIQKYLRACARTRIW